MKIPLLLAATLAVSLALPSAAQTQIEAPRGWTTQTRANGATTFTPPDLRAGEKYSITVYDSVSLGDKTPEAYLRDFAGPVGTKVGNLAAPLQIPTTKGQAVTGFGAYAGPNGAGLGVVFTGVSLDGGANIHVMRVMFSQAGVWKRYQAQDSALLELLVERAKAEAGDNLLVVPRIVRQKLKVVGGPLKPGVYAGNQYSGEELRYRLRVTVYPDGDYRFTDENDADFFSNYGSLMGVGTYGYNRVSGQLSLGTDFSMINSPYSFQRDEKFCYFGLDASGKPAIYAQEKGAFSTTRTALTWVAPPTKRPSPTQEDAQKAAIEAEKNRYKWTTAPGKGVPNAQIAAVVHFHEERVYSAGVGGLGVNITDNTYLLLKNGMIHRGLPVAPDGLDLARSRQNEPQSWGRWRQVGGDYQVSWHGDPYEALQGWKVFPGAPQTRLQGRFGTGTSSASLTDSSYALWGVTFSKEGRFVKDARGGSSNSQFMQSGGAPAINSTYDDNGSSTSVTAPGMVVTAGKKNNPNGDREGTYAINGYTITLRYDNGKIERSPFFFDDAAHKMIYFEGSTMS